MDDVTKLSRKERERLRRRKEMMDAARVIFARKGFTQTTLEDVAELSEFGKGTIYNYFPNKEALFRSVLEDSFDQTMTIARESLNSDLDFRERVRLFVERELEYFFSNPATMQLMMREGHHLRRDNPMMQLMPQLLQILAESVAAEQKKGTILDDVEPVELASILMNMVYGYFMSRIYRMICNTETTVEPAEMPDDDGGGRRVTAALLDAFSDQDVQAIAQNAATLIHTVFFRGVSR